MRKARYYYISKCKKCDGLLKYLRYLKEEYYIILEEYDLREDDYDIVKYKVGTFPAVVITDANDNDVVFYKYQGKVSDAAKEKIKEEMRVDEDD